MKAEKYIVNGTKEVDIRKLPTDSKKDKVNKEKIIEKELKQNDNCAELTEEALENVAGGKYREPEQREVN